MDLNDLKDLITEDAKFDCRTVEKKERAICLKCNKEFRQESKYNRLCIKCNDTNSNYRSTRSYRVIRANKLMVVEQAIQERWR